MGGIKKRGGSCGGDGPSDASRAQTPQSKGERRAEDGEGASPSRELLLLGQGAPQGTPWGHPGGPLGGPGGQGDPLVAVGWGARGAVVAVGRHQRRGAAHPVVRHGAGVTHG